MSVNPAMFFSKILQHLCMSERMIPWVFCAISIVFFAQGLGVHGIEYRDDEIFYYRSTNEMVTQDNYLSPTYFGENRFQKPIFFYWLIILSYKIFGPGWFAARFVSVVFAGLAVLLTWMIGRELFDRKTATLGCLILASIPLFFRHAKNAVPDMALNVFIIGAFYFLMKFLQDPSRRIFNILFFIFCGLGFMIKGFAAIVIPCAAILVITGIQKNYGFLRKLNFPFGVLILAVIILPWFLFMIAKHGDGYLYYILHTETFERAVSASQDNLAVKLLKTFFTNAAFYFETIFSYYAPWCLFLIGAIPLAVKAVWRKEEKGNAFLFLLVWFLTGFLFFSLISAKINHLILVMTTPFALLISSFFLKIFEQPSKNVKIAGIVVQIVTVALAALGFLGLTFIRVILLGESIGWAYIFLFMFVIGVWGMLKAKSRMVLPVGLAAVILFVFSHVTLLSKAGLVSLSSLQDLAETVHQKWQPGDIIAVGSHDIHEKELQIYFDDPVLKAATSVRGETLERLDELFQSPRTVYCLFTEEDYRIFLKNGGIVPQILKEDSIFRRRIYPDRRLLEALLKFDRLTVQHYFMEKIILVCKRSDA